MQGRDPRPIDELILYLAQRMERDAHVGRGRIKLAKLLFFIDFEAYARFTRPVSGSGYHADKLGPAPSDELTATRDLQADGRFEWRHEWDRQELPVALDEPVLDVFSPRERALIDEMLERYRRVSSKRMVDEAHEFSGWVHAWNGGEGKGTSIPYESIFWDGAREVAEPWENEYARQLVGRHR